MLEDMSGAPVALVASRASVGLAGLGVSSTVLCLPVVQGGMERNSSKVSTRGLQHAHPFVSGCQNGFLQFRKQMSYLFGLHGRRADRDGRCKVRPGQ